MNILRTDGEYTIYTFQNQWEPDGPWRYIEGDFLRDFSSEEFKTYPNLHDFTVHGECWKKTGIHGCFDYETALTILSCIVRKREGLRHRIVEINIKQNTIVKHDMCEGKQVKGGVKHQMAIGIQHAPE